MRSWLKNTSRLVLIFLIVFLCWHYFKKLPSLIRQIKDKGVVMAYCMDGDGTDCYLDSDSGSDSDSDSETQYKEIPDDPTDPDWPQFQADAANPAPDPSLCDVGCSYWNNQGELVVKDAAGQVIRVWQPYEAFEDPSELDTGDSGGSGGTTCTLYCPASTAPQCGGSCSGCYQWATCENDWDCDKPGCSCSCVGQGEERYCNVSGSYCATQCSEWGYADCPTNHGCEQISGPSTTTCMTPSKIPAIEIAACVRAAGAQ